MRHIYQQRRPRAWIGECLLVAGSSVQMTSTKTESEGLNMDWSFLPDIIFIKVMTKLLGVIHTEQHAL